jgi:hypothetical protein
MKQVSLGGLDVSWLGRGAMGMSAFAENANRGDHALLLSPWRTSTPCCCARACLDSANASLPGCPPDDRHLSAAVACADGPGQELAGSPGGGEYAAALRVLFALDPPAVEAVTRAAPEAAVHSVRRHAAESSYSYPDHGGTR